jgi:hypothetical protein
VIPSLTLASGDCMPAVGLGLWKVGRPETADVVQGAIRAGYRHLDCACSRWTHLRTFASSCEALRNISTAVYRTDGAPASRRASRTFECGYNEGRGSPVINT